jgi:hypothetical protein
MIGKMSRTAVAVIAASVGILSAAPLAMGATAPASGVPTSFVFAGSGYAARVVGGSLPAGIGKVAFASLSCTNDAGLTHIRTAATLNLPGVGTIKGARTRTFSFVSGDTTSDWTVSKIASVNLLNLGGLGQLSLDGIQSVTEASHDSSGFHAMTTSTLGDITLTVLGIPTHFPVPPVGQTLTIPGLASISLGAGTTHVAGNSSSASNDAVKIQIIPLNTTIYLAHGQSRIQGGVRSALFKGGAYGVSANAAGGVVQLAKTPSQPMPCKGTDGVTKTNSTTAVSIPGVVDLSALSASDQAKASAKSANMWAEGDVAGVSLGGGALQITGVVGRASANLSHGVVTTSTAGTSVATVTLNGNPQTLPLGGTLTIPGIATLKSDVETPLTNGVSVISLQITLLDGTGATINIGSAKAQIDPSGL